MTYAITCQMYPFHSSAIGFPGVGGAKAEASGPSTMATSWEQGTLLVVLEQQRAEHRSNFHDEFGGNVLNTFDLQLFLFLPAFSLMACQPSFYRYRPCICRLCLKSTLGHRVQTILNKRPLMTYMKFSA